MLRLRVEHQVDCLGDEGVAVGDFPPSVHPLQLDLLIAEYDGLRVIDQILTVLVAENSAAFAIAQIRRDKVLGADGGKDVVELWV